MKRKVFIIPMSVFMILLYPSKFRIEIKTKNTFKIDTKIIIFFIFVDKLNHPKKNMFFWMVI